MSVAKVTQISAESKESFEDAIRLGIARAGKTIEHMKSAWVKEQKVKIQGDKVVSYQVHLEITFVLKE